MFRDYNSTHTWLRLKRKIEVPFHKGEYMLTVQIKTKMTSFNDPKFNHKRDLNP